MKRFFYLTINFLPEYEGSVLVKNQEGFYISTENGAMYRKRLLYDFGWGQENGFEIIPKPSFQELMGLIEQPMNIPQKRIRRYTKDELKEFDIWKNNFYGAISVIMQDYAEEFINYLCVAVDTDYFSNFTVKENFKYFSLDSKKARSEGKCVGHILGRSYEDVLCSFDKWLEISSKVICKIYN